MKRYRLTEHGDAVSVWNGKSLPKGAVLHTVWAETERDAVVSFVTAIPNAQPVKIWADGSGATLKRQPETDRAVAATHVKGVRAMPFRHAIDSGEYRRAVPHTVENALPDKQTTHRTIAADRGWIVREANRADCV